MNPYDVAIAIRDLGMATKIDRLQKSAVVTFKDGKEALSMLLSPDGGTVIYETSDRDRIVRSLDDMEKAAQLYEQWFKRYFEKKATRHNPSGDRFRACVQKMRNRPGVYSPEGLCATIGRRKYGKSGYAKLVSAGRRAAAKKRHRQ